MSDALPPNTVVPKIDGTLDTGPITINGTSSWQPVADIQLLGRDIAMQMIAGSGNITDFKLVILPHPSAQPNDLIASSDFSTASEVMPFVAPALPATTNYFLAANGNASMQIKAQPWILRLYAKGISTTIRILGNVLGRRGMRP